MTVAFIFSYVTYLSTNSEAGIKHINKNLPTEISKSKINWIYK